MKILWVTNIPFGPINDFLQIKPASSGSWLDATYKMVKDVKNLELVLVTVWPVDKLLNYKFENVSIYVLPKGKEKKYDVDSKKNSSYWEYIKEIEKPDILQIWGTEFSHGLLAQKVLNKIPSIIYMQGLMSQISKHYISDLSNKDIIKNITLRDIISFDNVFQQKKNFQNREIIEARMLKLAKYVIVENEWCAMHCKVINPQIIILYNKLPIKEEFFNYTWNQEKIEPNTILSIAGGYPIKGLHILLRALKIVKLQKENVKLFIPGDNTVQCKSFKDKIKITGYSKYLNFLIKKYKLDDNVKFLGRLNSNEMAELMSKTNVFVMPSSIENHSSSLIEAMIVGMPSIASYVGGIPEYVKNGENGFIYRFNEEEILAYYILLLLNNKFLAKNISESACLLTRENRQIDKIKEEVLETYKKICLENNINFQ